MWLVNFVKQSPLGSILLFSFVITFFLSWFYKRLIPQQEFQQLKQRQKELQQQLKQSRQDKAKLASVQKELLEISVRSMKLTMKPMLITFLPLVFVLYGLKKLYVDAAGIGNIIEWKLALPLIGTGGGWLFCYIVFGLIFSLILRKIFKL